MKRLILACCLLATPAVAQPQQPAPANARALSMMLEAAQAREAQATTAYIAASDEVTALKAQAASDKTASDKALTDAKKSCVAVASPDSKSVEKTQGLAPASKVSGDTPASK